MTPMSSDPSISIARPVLRPKEQPSTIADITVNVEPLPKYRLRYGFQLYRPDGTGGQPQMGRCRSRRGCGPDTARAVRPRPHRRRRWAIQLDQSPRSCLSVQQQLLHAAAADHGLFQRPMAARRLVFTGARGPPARSGRSSNACASGTSSSPTATTSSESAPT